MCSHGLRQAIMQWKHVFCPQRNISNGLFHMVHKSCYDCEQCLGMPAASEVLACLAPLCISGFAYVWVTFLAEPPNAMAVSHFPSLATAAPCASTRLQAVKAGRWTISENTQVKNLACHILRSKSLLGNCPMFSFQHGTRDLPWCRAANN
jgi:hypothetical protein